MVNYLVALDGSPHSIDAFFTAESLMQVEKDHLYLATVIPDIKSNVLTDTFGGIDLVSPFIEAQDRAKAEGENMLRKFGYTARSKKINFTLILGISSHIGEFLIQLSDRYKIDFIIVGRRGMGRVKRAFVGSTSKYVLEHASCNVLIVKGDYIHEDKKVLHEKEKDKQDPIPIVEFGIEEDKKK